MQTKSVVLSGLGGLLLGALVAPNESLLRSNHLLRNELQDAHRAVRAAHLIVNAAMVQENKTPPTFSNLAQALPGSQASVRAAVNNYSGQFFAELARLKIPRCAPPE
jgi:hypothetical protein